MKNLLIVIFIIPIHVMAQQLHKLVEIPFSDIELRKVNQDELKSLKVEYEAGTELMFWLAELEEDSLTREITLTGLQDAFDSLSQISKYPVAEYNSVWHATFGLAVVFAEQLRQDFGWQWMMIENSSKIKVGWSVVSADKRYGINVEQLFYNRVMRRAPIDIRKLYSGIEQTIAAKTGKKESVLFFDLP